MLAEVQPLSTDVFNPASPSFTVTFNPSPDPPTSSQFTFTNTDDDSAASNYVVVDTETTIEVTLVGATFSSPSVIWSIPPPDPTPVVPSNDNQTISFRVPAPTHYFQPWVFRISVNPPGDTPGDPPPVVGIRSPNIYLTNSQPPQFNLVYSPSNGNFNLMDTNSDPTQDGLISADELILVNAIVPYPSFIVELQTDADGDPTVPPAVFASPPVQLSNSAVSNSITVLPVPNSNQVVIGINSGASGQSTGLLFQIVYNGVTFLSPDPILINSTIGDG